MDWKAFLTCKSPDKEAEYPLCSKCFGDLGLRHTAERFGTPRHGAAPCPNCANSDGHALDRDALRKLQEQFFSRATTPNGFFRTKALLKLVDHEPDDPEVSADLRRPETRADWQLIKKVISGKLFHNKHRLLRFGQTIHFGPDMSLLKAVVRNEIVPRLRCSYLEPDTSFYRIRTDVDPSNSLDNVQYDAGPLKRRRFNRFDNNKLPLLYASPNLEVCIHECKVTLADKIFVATLAPTGPLSMVDLTGNYNQPASVHPSGDLHWFFQGLMGNSTPMAHRHCRRIAQTIKDMTEADGIIYNSYYTNVAGDSGSMPINYAFFGRPISDGKLRVTSINTIRLDRIRYDFHLGPVIKSDIQDPWRKPKKAPASSTASTAGPSP